MDSIWSTVEISIDFNLAIVWVSISLVSTTTTGISVSNAFELKYCHIQLVLHPV